MDRTVSTRRRGAPIARQISIADSDDGGSSIITALDAKHLHPGDPQLAAWLEQHSQVQQPLLAGCSNALNAMVGLGALLLRGFSAHVGEPTEVALMQRRVRALMGVRRSLSEAASGGGYGGCSGSLGEAAQKLSDGGFVMQQQQQQQVLEPPVVN